MTNKPISIQDRKLKTLLKILSLCFGGISAVFILAGGILMVVYGNVKHSLTFDSLSRMESNMILLILFASILGLVGAVGVICGVIYYILKFRLEKDEELFFKVARKA